MDPALQNIPAGARVSSDLDGVHLHLPAAHTHRLRAASSIIRFGMVVTVPVIGFGVVAILVSIAVGLLAGMLGDSVVVSGGVLAVPLLSFASLIPLLTIVDRIHSGFLHLIEGRKGQGMITLAPHEIRADSQRVPLVDVTRVSRGVVRLRSGEQVDLGEGMSEQTRTWITAAVRWAMQQEGAREGSPADIPEELQALSRAAPRAAERER